MGIEKSDDNAGETDSSRFLGEQMGTFPHPHLLASCPLLDDARRNAGQTDDWKMEDWIERRRKDENAARQESALAMRKERKGISSLVRKIKIGRMVEEAES